MITQILTLILLIVVCLLMLYVTWEFYKLLFIRLPSWRKAVENAPETERKLRAFIAAMERDE